MANNVNNKDAAATEMGWIAGAVVIVIAAWVIWHFFSEAVVMASFALDWVQVKAIELIVGLGPVGSDVKNFVAANFDGRLDPADVTWEEMTQVSSLVGQQTRLALAAIIVGMTVLVFFRMKGNGFRRAFSLAGGKGKGPSLIHYQAQHWKVAKPGALFNPSQANPSEDPALTPMEWMRAHGVNLTEEDGFDDESAAKAFSEQLGGQWKGLMRAPAHVQAVAVIAGLSARRAKEVTKIKEDLSTAGVDGKGATRIAAILKPYLADKRLVKVIDKQAAKHAYVNTAMFCVLDWARKRGGVLASAEFRWLKSVDRHLWYALNNCGRRAYLVEGAGTVAHFFAERVVGSPLTDPHVDEAVRGIDEYLEEQGIMDLEAFFRANDDE